MGSENLASTKKHTVRGYKNWLATICLVHKVNEQDLDLEEHGKFQVVAYTKLSDKHQESRPLGIFNKQINIGKIKWPN